jgi:hypothetical protein
MSGAPLITHRTTPAAIITRTRPTPTTIRGTSTRSQKRGSRLGDIGGTSLFGFGPADLRVTPLGVEAAVSELQACIASSLSAGTRGK